MSASRRHVRFLHTSDIHLAPNRRHGGGDHLDHCLCALASLRLLAMEHDVDAVLIAGDLFDHARIEEPFMQAVFGALDRFERETVLLVGNHDVHDATSLYGRYGHVVHPSAVHLLLDYAGAEVDLLDGAVRIWGKAMDEHHPGYRPLHGAGEHPGDRWYVVMGHGLHGDDRMTMGRSSIIRPDDIDATGADYVALGHIHVVKDVSTAVVPAWYCGSPTEARNPTALLVDLHPDQGAVVRRLDVEQDAGGCAHLSIGRSA